jgi:hypothetical protein
MAFSKLFYFISYHSCCSFSIDYNIIKVAKTQIFLKKIKKVVDNEKIKGYTKIIKVAKTQQKRKEMSMAGVLELDKPYHNLKGIIVSKGLKQNDIADKLGMDKSTLSVKLNRYKGRDFTFSEASKLAELLGIKMEDF